LDRVVRVDVQVAGAREPQVEATVARERVEHVIEEADARAHLRLPGPVQVQACGDIGLARLAVTLGGAGSLGHRYGLSAIAWPSPSSRRKPGSNRWILACAGMTAKRQPLDSGFCRNDGPPGNPGLTAKANRWIPAFARV